MTTERRFVPLDSSEIELEERAGDKLPKISGYAAVFYVPEDSGTEYKLFDNLVERIMPRAFNRALKDKDNAAALFNHNPDMLLGRVSSKTLKLSKDQRGLRYDIVPPDTSVGRDVVESINRGDITGSSFSFTVTDQKFVTEDKGDGTQLDVREIHGVQLYDVGPVVFPAYGGTSTGMRADSRDLTEVRSAYQAWKDDNNRAAQEALDAEKQKQEVEARIASRLERVNSLAELKTG